MWRLVRACFLYIKRRRELSASVQRAYRLHTLSTRLSKIDWSGPASSTSELEQQVLMSDHHKKQYAKTVEELFALCESVPSVRHVMDRYGANRDTLRNAHQRLMAGGAGQWAGGHYVAASAFAY